jgi:hypothetical protein
LDHELITEAILGQVVFRCPKTGQDFESGFHANPNDLQFLPEDARINLLCRICGEKHEFKFTEGRISGDE